LDSSRHFEKDSQVFRTLREITKRLDELGIPYAVAGAMAMFEHGVRRFTEDVDILVSPEGLKQIHQKLVGRGYRPKFERSKNLRDTSTGVSIEFIVEGHFPGDGRPKPVAFPSPESVTQELDGIKFLNLTTLVELKLASGISSADRAKDLVDVQEIVRTLALPQEFGNQLADYVRPKYDELWALVNAPGKTYEALWRNKWLTAEATSLDEMIRSLREAADQLEAMKVDGVVLDADGGTSDDYARLVTTDPVIARKYDMHEESEFWDEVDESDESADNEPPDTVTK
jgi:hypothetical protein